MGISYAPGTNQRACRPSDQVPERPHAPGAGIFLSLDAPRVSPAGGGFLAIFAHCSLVEKKSSTKRRRNFSTNLYPQKSHLHLLHHFFKKKPCPGGVAARPGVPGAVRDAGKRDPVAHQRLPEHVQNDAAENVGGGEGRGLTPPSPLAQILRLLSLLRRCEVLQHKQVGWKDNAPPEENTAI